MSTASPFFTVSVTFDATVSAPTGVSLSVQAAASQNITSGVYALAQPMNPVSLQTSFNSPIPTDVDAQASWETNFVPAFADGAAAAWATVQVCTVVFSLVGPVQTDAPVVFAVPYAYGPGEVPAPATLSGLSITPVQAPNQTMAFAISGAVIPSALQCTTAFGPPCTAALCATAFPVAQSLCRARFPCPTLPPARQCNPAGQPVTPSPSAPSSEKTAVAAVAAVAAVLVASVAALVVYWYVQLRPACVSRA